MRACNCGEALNSSVQKNAAEMKVAMKARLQFFERANLLIAPRACLHRVDRASKFPGRDGALRRPDAAARRPYQLVVGLSAGFNTPLKSDPMIGLGSIPGC